MTSAQYRINRPFIIATLVGAPGMRVLDGFRDLEGAKEEALVYKERDPSLDIGVFELVAVSEQRAIPQPVAYETVMVLLKKPEAEEETPF